MIERLLSAGATEAGNYAQAFRLFDALAMIPVMFGGMLLPIMTRGLSSGNDIRPLAKMAARMLLAPLGVGAVTLASFPEEILDLLYLSPAASAVTSFRILMIALVPAGVIYIYSTMLTAAWKLKVLAKITLSGMFLNVALNLVLIPKLGIAGAACTALITQTVVAVACMMAVRKTMTGIAGNGRIVKYLLMLVLTFLAGWLLRQTGITLAAAAAVQLGTGVVMALIFRFTEPLTSLRLITGQDSSPRSQAKD
ncbi:hypothetical protein EG830_04725 [bacterium]|nr:hypothetical protein [bacterium]